MCSLIQVSPQDIKTLKEKFQGLFWQILTTPGPRICLWNPWLLPIEAHTYPNGSRSNPIIQSSKWRDSLHLLPKCSCNLQWSQKLEARKFLNYNEISDSIPVLKCSWTAIANVSTKWLFKIGGRLCSKLVL